MLSARLRSALLCSISLVLVSCEESQLKPPEPPPPGDASAPTVLDVAPDDGETGVQGATTVRAAFSERVEPSTLTSSSFVVSAVGVVAGDVTLSDSVATFTPTSPLEPNTTYTALITTAVRDLAGNALPADYVWTFTTGPPADTTPPIVVAVSPLDGATGVVVSTTVQATFSEIMNPASVGGATFRLSGPVGAISGTISLTGSVVVFTPSSPLESNTTYTARITTGAEDLAGNHIASEQAWTFTTAPPPDETRPTIISVFPLSTETGVDLGTSIRATFSEEVAAASVHAGTFLVSGTSPVAGTVTLSDFTATFTPSSPLAPNTTYTARVTTGVEDLAGNSLASDYVWTFTTAPPRDETPPVVAAVTPQNGATGVTTGTAVTGTFSESVSPASVSGTTFLLSGGGSGSVSGTVILTDKTATFTPSSTLTPNTVYTARLTTGIEDLAGNNLAAAFVWSFTTAPMPDETRPTVVDDFPSNGATNVAHGTVVRATFSEPMTPASVNGTTFRLRSGAGAVTGSVALSGQVATFTPSTPLAANTTYTAEVTTGVADLAGNNMAAAYTWSFTTAPPPDLTRPTVTSTDPLQGDTNVDVEAVVRGTFSEAVSPSSVNTTTFLLTGGVGAVSGVVSLSGTTATFTPAGPLEANTTYAARLATGVEDLAGNHLATDYTWTFTTAPPPDGTPPSVVSVLPFNGATDVDRDINVTATFSEPVAPASVSSTTFRLVGGASAVSGTVTLSGQTATFNPASSLAYSTLYTARVTTGVEDLAGNNMTSDFVWTFRTLPEPDITRPTVVAVVPLHGAVNVDEGTTVRATFSEAVSSPSVNALTFRLSGGAGSVSGTVSLAGQTATFTPSSPLAFGTTYTARVTTGVEDLAGNKLASDHVWTFATEAAPDVIPPTVATITPANGATGVDPDVNATATFSEPVDPASVSGTTFRLDSTGGPVSGTVTISGQTATFNPSSPLNYSTTYTARVTTGVQDLAGNNMTSDRVWTFTTEAAPDLTPPTIVSVTPPAGATGIDPDVNATATFSEPVDAASVNGTTFLLSSTAGSVAGTVTLSGQTATCNPSGPLAFSTTYTARVTTGVQDLAGNNIASDHVWTFTTEAAPDVTPPTVTSVSPANGATGIDPGANATATFSEPVDPASLNGTTFRLSSAAGAVSGTVTLSGQTATFNPSGPLAFSTTYTARVTTGVQDLAGNNITADHVWTFTTVDEPDVIPPTVVTVAPPNAATGVDPNANATATFSEPVDPASVNATTFRLTSTAGAVTGTVTLSEQTATFNPSGPLAFSTTYTARVTTGVEDLAGNNMTADRVWSFTTAAEPDVTPPTVATVTPANGAIGIDPDVNATATFSEPVDAASVNGTTFLLSSEAGAVTGAVTLSGQTATFNPSGPLAFSTTYTARITTGVQDLAGNNMTGDRVWTFTTGAEPDVTPPTVVSVTPLNAESGVDANVNGTATFSEPVDPASVDVATFLMSGGAGSVSGTVTLLGQTATFDPLGPLDYSTTYTARVTTGIQDLAGNNMAADFVWTFTTGPEPDTTPPTVTAESPEHGSTDVDPDADATATFSEPVDPASVDGTSFQLSSDAGSVSGTVALLGQTATFDPASQLDYSTTYMARVTTGVQDLAGNNLNTDYIWTFTTAPEPDTTPPTVTGMLPLPGATDVGFGTTVSATFSEAVDPSSVTSSSFTLSGTQAVSGTLAVNGSTVTFTPDAPLAASTLHTATVTTGIRDLAGNALESDAVWTFTTTHLPPVADAGPNQDVLILSTVTLDGTGSFDPEGQPLTYVWTQVRGADVTGGSGELHGSNPSFTAPLLPDRLDFDLRVSDGTFTSLPDRVRIDVVLANAAENPEGSSAAPPEE